VSAKAVRRHEGEEAEASYLMIKRFLVKQRAWPSSERGREEGGV
jgi:hypothetical protein